jgi:Cu-Zn family superoxide dismutase
MLFSGFRATAAAALAAGAAAATALAAPAKTAVCILAPPPGAAPGAGVTGTVTFTQREGDARVSIRVRASGLAPGLHGFHIHALGDLTQGCISAGGHFNPASASHGGPQDAVRHAGDLGNVEADARGIVDATIVDSAVSLLPASPASIVGRSCVLHADEDDLGRGGHADSLTTGHAGARLTCGVIGLAADTEVA